MWIMFHKRCFGHICYKIRSDHVTSRQFVANLVLIVVGNFLDLLLFLLGAKLTIPFMNLCCIGGPSIS